MNKYITLPVLFHSSNTSSLMDCSVEWKLSDCKIKEVDFYVIDSVTYVEEDGIEYGQIYSGGQSYYSTLTRFYIHELIDESNMSEFVFYDN